MLITKKNFKYQKKYAYDGDDKYPRFILRGKKISKEQAEKIIISETESRVFAFNNKILDYDEFDHDSIKKPLSIRETMDEEEREKSIDENSYIKSYDKLYKEYNTIINNCFMY